MTTEPAVIERELHIDARPEIVFAYFTDPERMTRWMGTEAQLDPRAGGGFRCNVTGNDVAVGEYVEVTPYSRIVFTWGWEGDNPLTPGSSTIEVTLAEEGDGTLLRFVHRDLPAEAVGPHADGWTHFLDRLAVAAAGGDPGPDPWVDSPPGGE